MAWGPVRAMHERGPLRPTNDHGPLGSMGPWVCAHGAPPTVAWPVAACGSCRPMALWTLRTPWVHWTLETHEWPRAFEAPIDHGPSWPMNGHPGLSFILTLRGPRPSGMATQDLNIYGHGPVRPEDGLGPLRPTDGHGPLWSSGHAFCGSLLAPINYQGPSPVAPRPGGGPLGAHRRGATWGGGGSPPSFSIFRSRCNKWLCGAMALHMAAAP